MLTYLAASLILCAYTWVGYPLLIGLLAFVRPLKAPQTRGWQPSVSACVAVHNGERYIKAKLESLLSQLYPADRIEVLVYADGCTDGTETVVAEMAASDPRVRLLPGAREAHRSQPHAP
jgi:poly-beta-1,6-N-acetyl-D-glucosamine synthase